MFFWVSSFLVRIRYILQFILILRIFDDLSRCVFKHIHQKYYKIYLHNLIICNYIALLVCFMRELLENKSIIMLTVFIYRMNFFFLAFQTRFSVITLNFYRFKN